MTRAAPACERAIPWRLLATSIPGMMCLIIVGAACGVPGSERGRSAEVTRDTFVAVYVDLRVAALRAEDGELTDSARNAILEEHGVAAEDLLDFAAARSSDFAFMRELWNEIEMRLDSVPPLERDP